MLSAIKDEYKSKVVVFGKSPRTLPLGQRDDIDDLAIIARESGDKSLIRLFSTLPELADLKKAKTDAELKNKKAAPEKQGPKQKQAATDKGDAGAGSPSTGGQTSKDKN